MVMVMIMGSACVIFAVCTHDASLCSDWHKLCAASATGGLFILTYIYHESLWGSYCLLCMCRIYCSR
jgi:hypothetical protein